MASVVGLLEARELVERERVEVLREQADRILAELAEAETRWQEWVIARQRVDEVLSPATSVASSTSPEPEPVRHADVQKPDSEAASGPRSARRGRRAVPVRRPGSDPRALPAGYREIVRAVAHAGADDGSVMDCSQIAVALGMEPVKANTEGRVRHRAKRLVARGWLAEPVPGRFSLADARGAGS